MLPKQSAERRGIVDGLRVGAKWRDGLGPTMVDKSMMLTIRVCVGSRRVAAYFATCHSAENHSVAESLDAGCGVPRAKNRRRCLVSRRRYSVGAGPP